MRPLPKSSRVMLFRRSLTSASGKVRSTRASPSTSPLRLKYPTPLLNSTTRVIGRLTAGFRSCLASPAPRNRSAPMPAPTPSAPASGATSSHLLSVIANSPGGRRPGAGREGAVRARHGSHHTRTPVPEGTALRPGRYTRQNREGHPAHAHPPRGGAAGLRIDQPHFFCQTLSIRHPMTLGCASTDSQRRERPLAPDHTTVPPHPFRSGDPPSGAGLPVGPRGPARSAYPGPGGAVHERPHRRRRAVRGGRSRRREATVRRRGEVEEAAHARAE